MLIRRHSVLKRQNRRRDKQESEKRQHEHHAVEQARQEWIFQLPGFGALLKRHGACQLPDRQENQRMHIAAENVPEISGAYHQKEQHETELRLQKFGQDLHAVVGSRVVAVSEDGRVPEIAAESESCTSQGDVGRVDLPEKKAETGEQNSDHHHHRRESPPRAQRAKGHGDSLTGQSSQKERCIDLLYGEVLQLSGFAAQDERAQQYPGKHV